MLRLDHDLTLADDVERIASVPLSEDGLPGAHHTELHSAGQVAQDVLGQVLERRERIDQLRRLHPQPRLEPEPHPPVHGPYAAPQAPYQSDGRADQGSGHEYGEQEQDEPRQESAVPQRLTDPAELGS